VTISGRPRTLPAIGLGLCLLAVQAVLAAPVAAVAPRDYLPDMPSVATVEAAFTGTDALDTAALRFDALLRLENIAKDMVGTRGPAGKALQAEADLITAYDDAQNQIIAQVKAGMPTDQQGFYVGTQFTAWAQLADRYQADATFNTRFRALFPATFRATYASTITAQEKADAVPLVPPTATGPAPVVTPRAQFAPDPNPVDPGQYLPILAWLGAYAVLFVLLGLRRPKGARAS
jgi:hypothetical protein